eukprot:c20015_g1_i1.p1 GENE.c20015_g1_i1~~c20015_g1_i1.p1  ORF type:complete len:306 (+),score=55.92 c20015_g1_i1:38-955(+)
MLRRTTTINVSSDVSTPCFDAVRAQLKESRGNASAVLHNELARMLEVLANTPTPQSRKIRMHSDFGAQTQDHLLNSTQSSPEQASRYLSVGADSAKGHRRVTSNEENKLSNTNGLKKFLWSDSDTSPQVSPEARRRTAPAKLMKHPTTATKQEIELLRSRIMRGKRVSRKAGTMPPILLPEQLDSTTSQEVEILVSPAPNDSTNKQTSEPYPAYSPGVSTDSVASDSELDGGEECAAGGSRLERLRRARQLKALQFNVLMAASKLDRLLQGQEPDSDARTSHIMATKQSLRDQLTVLVGEAQDLL